MTICHWQVFLISTSLLSYLLLLHFLKTHRIATWNASQSLMKKRVSLSKVCSRDAIIFLLQLHFMAGQKKIPDQIKLIRGFPVLSTNDDAVLSPRNRHEKNSRQVF